MIRRGVRTPPQEAFFQSWTYSEALRMDKRAKAFGTACFKGLESLEGSAQASFPKYLEISEKL